MTTSHTAHDVPAPPPASLPRLVGDPHEETFADFWITYQLCANERGALEWSQIHYAGSKQEALATLKPVLQGRGFKMEDGETEVSLRRDGRTLFRVVRQLLNYGWYDEDARRELLARIPTDL